jgi:DNA-binding CsgD family transcriptional regulator
MQQMLRPEYMSVLEATTREALLTESLRFCRRIGFEIVSAMAVVDRESGGPQFITVDNAPAGYVERAGDAVFGKNDPVMQHCKHRGVPLVWDQGTYLRANQGEKWELQASYGYRCGVAVALHLPQGRHFVFGVDRDQALPDDSEELTRMVAAVQLFAVHAQAAAMHALAPDLGQPMGVRLTPRELETLRWTLDGKTAWEIGRIPGIAESTANRHAHSASRKLGCGGKHQAALKALRLGLIR